MVFFNNLMISLKQKWLQFFQSNRAWIVQHMEVESVYTPDGGRRPPAYLILGVVNALEPQLAQLMLPFSRLNPNVDTLIDVLGLNFDPELVLGRSAPQSVIAELDDDTPNFLIAVDQSELNDILLDEVAEQVVLDEENDAFVIISPDEVAALTDISFDEMADQVVLVETDDELIATSTNAENPLGNMSLEQMAAVMGLEQLDEDPPQTPSATQPLESNDLLSDVWEEGTSLETEQAKDETNSGDENQSKQDSDISRPNS